MTDKILPQTIQAYIDKQRINGIKDSTIRDQTSKLLMANDWKPYINWKKDDVTKYILYLKDKKLKDSYIENIKSLLKSFLIFHNKEAYVKDLKIKHIVKKLKPTEIINADDVDKLIQCADNNRDKALIALLIESGARINEILDIKVSDIQETENGMVINIHGTKTGEEYRPCICIYSGQYIRNHILYPVLKNNDKLFDMHDTTARRILQKLKIKSGINKPLNPHAFRHARATYMVKKGYNESIIRAQLGWTDDSGMIARYVSIDGQDVINSVLEKDGNKKDIHKEFLKNINIAEAIRIADPSLMIKDMKLDAESKYRSLEDENIRLNQELEALRGEYIKDAEATKIQIEEMKNFQIEFFKNIKNKYEEKV